jgi:hypothetical protein
MHAMSFWASKSIKNELNNERAVTYIYKAIYESFLSSARIPVLHPLFEKGHVIISDLIRYFIINNFIHSSMVLQPFVGLWPLFFSFIIIFTQTVRLLGRVISPCEKYSHV